MKYRYIVLMVLILFTLFSFTAYAEESESSSDLSEDKLGSFSEDVYNGKEYSEGNFHYYIPETWRSNVDEFGGVSYCAAQSGTIRNYYGGYVYFRSLPLEIDYSEFSNKFFDSYIQAFSESDENEYEINTFYDYPCMRGLVRIVDQDAALFVCVDETNCYSMLFIDNNLDKEDLLLYLDVLIEEAELADKYKTKIKSKVTDKEYTLTVYVYGEKYILSGLYSGALINSKPDGKGKFIWTSGKYGDEDYVEITYNGMFSKGKIRGEGKLEMADSYVHSTWEGKFVNGGMNGDGYAYYESGDEFMMALGNFEKTLYSPTAAEIFDNIGYAGFICYYSLTNEVIEYINSNTNLFPIVEDPESIEDIQEFDYRKYNKTNRQDNTGLVKLNLHALQVFEYRLYDYPITESLENGTYYYEITEGEEILTTIIAIDDEGNYYALYYLDTIEVYDGDDFIAYAIPTDRSGFDNISGGVTNVIVFLCSYIE